MTHSNIMHIFSFAMSSWYVYVCTYYHVLMLACRAVNIRDAYLDVMEISMTIMLLVHILCKIYIYASLMLCIQCIWIFCIIHPLDTTRVEGIHLCRKHSIRIFKIWWIYHMQIHVAYVTTHMMFANLVFNDMQHLNYYVMYCAVH